jgi:hypothetical protein
MGCATTQQIQPASFTPPHEPEMGCEVIVEMTDSSRQKGELISVADSIIRIHTPYEAPDNLGSTVSWNLKEIRMLRIIVASNSALGGILGATVGVAVGGVLGLGITAATLSISAMIVAPLGALIGCVVGAGIGSGSATEVRYYAARAEDMRALRAVSRDAVRTIDTGTVRH